ncbi:MAG: sugar phosphate isomerase/epimerase [Clostridia bacterium]|nr:sugar phosphate isomerase/epimerase [Clostridia bacterium]
MRKIGINYGAKGGLEPEDYAKTMRALGFDAVFTGTPAPERISVFGEAFAKHGIEWETLHAPFKNINNIWLEGEGGEAMIAQLLGAVDACVLAGVSILVVHLSSGLKPPSITDIGRKRFAELVEYAAKKNVRIAFENQRKLANLAWAFEAFEEAPNVGFCYDTGHEGCFTPGREYMPLFGQRLICTHIHDNSGVFDHDEHMIPFDGNLNFDRVTRQIRESGFTGSLMLEVLSGHTHLYDDMTCEAYLEKAAAAVKRLRDMVDG